MSSNLDSPVKTRMAVGALTHPFSREYRGSRIDVNPHGRRHVFVQTDSSCVLDIELDRDDNAHTVKRKLKVALDVPKEETSITCDTVLENDLNAVCNDSSLLLTKNLHKWSSTPCLSSTAKDLQQKDRSGQIEILGCSSLCSGTKQLVKDVAKSIKSGIDPIPAHGGLGGAYYFRNIRGESVAIVKPTDEEPFAPNNPKGFVGKTLGQPGLKRSIRVGETGYREVAAYLLDYDHFANVPPTVLVKITHPVFHVNDVCININKASGNKNKAVSKIASFQQYIPHDFDASDHGTSSFPVKAVHRIGILDVRIFNTDRHAGNLLVRKVKDGNGKVGGQVELIPIDHGLALPETLEDPYFEWIHWPQASIPFSEEELDYIARLDPLKDSEMLRMELPMIREACLRVLVLCTIFLKVATQFGLCLAEIGEMMSREFRGRDEEPSELEVLCLDARQLIEVREPITFPNETGEEEFQFDIECEDDDFSAPEVPLSYDLGVKGRSARSLLPKLEEEDEDEDEDPVLPSAHMQVPSKAVAKLSMSLKETSLSGKTRVGRSNSSVKNTYSGCQGQNRSADEQLPPSASFMKIADMGNEEWGVFLEKFQDLLPDAIRRRKCGTTGQRQRMGTSCKF